MKRPPYQLFSLLLLYPDETVLGARGDLRAAIDALPRSAERAALERFWEWFGASEPRRLQQAYVETFDLQKRSSLHLTFFGEGDTRKRGQALLRLKRIYASSGLELDARELPDFLPVMLEFAELAPDRAGARLLTEHRAGLELLRVHLTDASSPYRHVIEAICAGLPRAATTDLELVARLVKDGPPSEQVGLEPFAPPEVMPMDASLG